jgi:hypothetical protein
MRAVQSTELQVAEQRFGSAGVDTTIVSDLSREHAGKMRVSVYQCCRCMYVYVGAHTVPCGR